MDSDSTGVFGMKCPQGSHCPDPIILNAQEAGTDVTHVGTHRCTSHKAAISEDQFIGSADVLEQAVLVG
jgi:hypothetical protein